MSDINPSMTLEAWGSNTLKSRSAEDQSEILLLDVVFYISRSLMIRELSVDLDTLLLIHNVLRQTPQAYRL